METRADALLTKWKQGWSWDLFNSTSNLCSVMFKTYVKYGLFVIKTPKHLPIMRVRPSQWIVLLQSYNLLVGATFYLIQDGPFCENS